jgi:hypothetical protein
MSNTTNTQLIPNSVPCGIPACEGRKSITTIIDFSLGLNFTLDLTAITSQLQFIRSVQTLYIDNLGNTSPVTITMGVTLQRITFPANAQGYVPILQPNQPVLQFANTLPNTVKIQILNFFLPPIIWGNTGVLNAAGALEVSDTILDNIVVGGALQTVTQPNTLNALIDRSGTITTGGTVQSLMAANTTRKRFIISNPSTATEILQFMFGANTAGRIDLAPGMTWDENNITVVGEQIFVVAATTAHKFTAYEQ